MWKVARFIRKEILDRDKRVFTGTFNDFENPPMRHRLLKWILLGTSNHIENETPRKGVDHSVSVVYQFIIQPIKLQNSNYKPQKMSLETKKLSAL